MENVSKDLEEIKEAIHFMELYLKDGNALSKQEVSKLKEVKDDMEILAYGEVVKYPINK